MSSTPLNDRLDQSPLAGDALRPVRLEPAAPLPPEPAEPAEPAELDLATEPVDQRKPRAVIKELFETVVFVLLVFFIVRGLVQNFKIEGLSMFPTMHHEQYILVNKAVYFHFDLNAPLRLLPGRGELPSKVIYPFHQPRKGDIIVFRAPNIPLEEAEKDYIKRVIATAGQTVKVLDGKVYVNDQLQNELSFLESTMVTTCRNYEPTCTVTVPQGHIFVMGDNRPNSSDSRDWGPLPLENVIGQAWLSYWPREQWGVVSAQSYAQQ